MKKKVRRGYNKGIKKYLIFFLLCLIAYEGLALYFPMLLLDLTVIAEDTFNDGSTGVGKLVLHGFLLLAFIILIFGVQFLTELMGNVYADKYQGNIRKSLYDKFSRMSNEQIDQMGIARILPIMMNDSGWLKSLNRRLIQTCVVFPVAILGSIIVLFTFKKGGDYTWVYGVTALASIPIVLLFFYLNSRRMGKFIPKSVSAYDEYFLNVKEGITGAKDIRILGKAEERSADFEQNVLSQQRQWLATNRAHHLSKGFNAILFTTVTIGIILFGAHFNVSTERIYSVAVLNTAVQYIDKIRDGTHTMFTWFVDYIPRCRYTVKRYNKIYALPEQPLDGGLEQLPVYSKHHLQIQNLSFQYPNGKMELDDVSIDIPSGQAVAIAGGIGSGKSVLSQILLKFKDPTAGRIILNDIDIAQLNPSFWRRELLSFCSGSPRFIPGTIRDNMRFLNPDITDEEIMKTFRDMGAMDFVDKFEGYFLDFIINDHSLNDSAKNVLNIVRTVLKNAEIYVFNQCFEHVKYSYITRLMARLKRENKTCLFITYDGTVCKSCDTIYVLKKGRISDIGTHEVLIKSNKDYRVLHTSEVGVFLYEETGAEDDGLIASGDDRSDIHNVVEGVVEVTHT